MHASDEPVKSEEQLRAGFVQGELRAGHQMLVDVFLVFEGLQHQEGQSERRRLIARHAYNQAAKITRLRPPLARPRPL